MNDTVFALSTPPGGAIAVIRLSGPEALKTATECFTGRLEPRRMAYGRLYDERGTIDEITACYYRAPASYTGEDVVELFTHGGAAIVRRALAHLAKNLRAAAPGEFTKRAFLAGKLTLDEAEAVMDIINSLTERSARTALEQLEGSVGRAVGEISRELTHILAGVDAALDFPEELEEDTLSSLEGDTALVLAKLDRLIISGVNARFIRDGATVAILGAPNAGKSSLFNAILGRERAIVTPLPGTTRDTLEERIDLGGIPVRLFDTAGLREASDEAERMGVDRAVSAMESSDAVILAFDATKPLTEADRELIRDTASLRRVAALCKSDLPEKLTVGELSRLGLSAYSVSAVTLEGIDALSSAVSSLLMPESESALVTNSRHISCLTRARESLASLDVSDGADCAATLIRASLEAIDEITGADASDDVIEAIFANFCVGK